MGGYIKLRELKKRNILFIAIYFLPIILSFVFVLYYGVNVIVNDEWEIVVNIDKIIKGTCDFSHLARPHNEHIIFFPQIFMILLAFLTRYNNMAEMCSVLFLLMISLFVFYQYFKKTFGFGKNLFWFIPVPFLIFSLRQNGNMLNGFQVTFLFAFTFSLLTFYFIFLLGESKNRKSSILRFSLAVICGTVAAYSSSMGLLVWIAGFLQLLISLIKRKKKIIYTAIWFFIGVVEWIIYMLSISRDKLIDFKSIINKFVWYIKYFFELLGNSLFSYGIVSLVVGVMIIVSVIFCLVLLGKNNRLKENSFLIAVVVFSILTIISITIGRTTLSTRSTFPSRYTTFTILLVVALYIMSVYLNLFTKSNIIKIIKIVLIVFIAISVCISYYDGIYIGQGYKEHRQQQSFILSKYKILPIQILRHIYPPSGEKIEKYAPVLEKLNFNVFCGEQKFPEFNKDLPVNSSDALMRVDELSINTDKILEVKYEMTYPYSENDFLDISGWAVDSEVEDSASGVFIEVDGKIYPAYYGLDRVDVADYYGNKNYRYSGYVGYIRFSDMGNGVHDIGIKILSKDKKTYYDAGIFKLYLTASEKEENISSSSFIKEDNSRYRINIDVYEEDMIVSGDTILKGWVIDQKDINYTDKVTILVYDGHKRKDENYIGIAHYFLFRPDVAKAFGVKEYEYSGFEYTLDTTKLENGYHSIYIYALNEDGVYSSRVYRYMIDN